MYDRFRQILDKKNLTPYQVGKDTEILQSTLSQWKSGRSIPKVDKLIRIADYLGVSLNYLMTGKD